MCFYVCDCICMKGTSCVPFVFNHIFRLSLFAETALKYMRWHLKLKCFLSVNGNRDKGNRCSPSPWKRDPGRTLDPAVRPSCEQGNIERACKSSQFSPSTNRAHATLLCPVSLCVPACLLTTVPTGSTYRGSTAGQKCPRMHACKQKYLKMDHV